MLGGVFVAIALVVAVFPAPGFGGHIKPVAKEKSQRRLEPALLVFGGLCALAYIVENAWQSWSAVHLDTTLGAAPALASSAPAVFAAAAATGRLSGNVLLRRVKPAQLLVAGGAIAALAAHWQP